IHGTHDELIPIAEGKTLFEKAGPPKQAWWVEGAGHNDVSMTARAEYGRRLRAWLDEVSEL
ncbi:MAG: alpha/beta hydrolase, partial [Deltaproteobacteria bacterium]|nr:alpha/beta hydrolase [Deltaproteobacteria bacterium]